MRERREWGQTATDKPWKEMIDNAPKESHH